MTQRPSPPAPTSSAPRPVVDEAVVSDAATVRPGGTDAPSGGDWLGEATRRPAPSPADGVPVDTRARGDHRRGRANESKRGHRG